MPLGLHSPPGNPNLVENTLGPLPFRRDSWTSWVLTHTFGDVIPLLLRYGVGFVSTAWLLFPLRQILVAAAGVVRKGEVPELVGETVM